MPALVASAPTMGGACPRRVGHFEIRGRLGSGSLGVVLDAVLPDGRSVALKLIRPEGDESRMAELTARIRREVRILRRVRHPGVVALVEAGDIDGILYLAVERVRGRSLREVMRQGPLAPAMVVELGLELSDTLAHLHTVGIVHRDIKPESVIINAAGSPILGDLGLARMSGGTAVTRRDILVGSLGYIAPEIIDGEEPSPKSDQFALGRLLFNLLAPGAPDSAARSLPIRERLRASVHLDWSWFPDGPAHRALRPILERMTREDPALRYSSLHATILDLAQHADARSPQAAIEGANAGARQARTLGADAEPRRQVHAPAAEGQAETIFDPSLELVRLLACAVEAPTRIAPGAGPLESAPLGGGSDLLSADLERPAGLAAELQIVEESSRTTGFLSVSSGSGLVFTGGGEETNEIIGRIDPKSPRGQGGVQDAGLRHRGVVELWSAGVLEGAGLDERELRRRSIQFWRSCLSEPAEDEEVGHVASGAEALTRWRHLANDLVLLTEVAAEDRRLTKICPPPSPILGLVDVVRDALVIPLERDATGTREPSAVRAVASASRTHVPRTLGGSPSRKKRSTRLRATPPQTAPSRAQVLLLVVSCFSLGVLASRGPEVVEVSDRIRDELVHVAESLPSWLATRVGGSNPAVWDGLLLRAGTGARGPRAGAASEDTQLDSSAGQFHRDP